MKKIIFFFISLIICLHSNQAQTLRQSLIENITPQSPEVFNMVRNSFYPTNHTTGAVNTEIPIYTIKTKQLELPISISYHNSGIKVDDIAGSIGLGWTLNAGGSLSVQGSRTFKFLDDYKAYDLAAIGGDLYSQIAKEVPSGPSEIFDRINEMMTQSRPSSSERFSYNVPGHISGQFVFDMNNEIKQIPLTDNKIEKIRGVLGADAAYGIKITAPNGTKYYFIDYQTSSQKSIISPVTGIYLKKIVSADSQDSIVFQYKNIDTYYPSTTVTFKGQAIYDSSKPKLDNDYYTQYRVDHTDSSFGVKDWILDKIIFNGGEVLFTSKKDRKDFYPERIVNITVNKLLPNSAKQQVVSCDLSNDEYFISDGLNQRPKESKLFHRLKLSGVNILSSNSNEAPQEYRFYYNPTKLPYYDNMYDFLPPSIRNYRACYAQDRWGYYNGKINNKHLAMFNSKITIERFYKIWDCGYFIPNRDISEEHAKAASLEKVSYPSGGYVVFDLESNRDDQGFLKAGLRIKRQHLYDRDHTLLEDRQYEYNSTKELMSDRDIDDFLTYREGSYTMVRSSNPYITGYDDWNTQSQVYMSTAPLPYALPSAQMYYTQVTEYQGGPNLNEGKIVYQYGFTEDNYYYDHGGGNTYVRFYKVLIDNSWLRSQLGSESFYKKESGSYKLIQKKNYNYNLYDSHTFINGMLIYRDYVTTIKGIMHIPNNFVRSDFHWYNTFSSTGAIKQISTTTTLYDVSGNETAVVETLDYDKISATTNPHQNVTRKTVQLSDGSSDITRYIYPLDYSYSATNSSAYKVNKQFRDAHILSIPFEQIKSRKTGTNELAYGGEFYDYEGINRLKTISTLNTLTPVGYTGATTIGSTGYNKSPLYTTETTINYDDYNNIKEVVDRSGFSTSYLWSYNSLHPIAEIKNATSAQVAEALQKSGLKYNDLVKTMSPDIQKIKDLSLSDAHISVFAFNTLVGVSAILAPNKTGLNYAYDGFNRLSMIKDHNANVVAAYKYNINSESSNVFMRADQTYRQYRKGSATIEVDNASASTSYQWTLTDKTNKILAQGTSKFFEFTPLVTGELFLKCMVSGGDLNKPTTLTRNINILLPQEMGVSEINPSGDEFRINGKVVTFNIKAIEGSMQYSYTWTMKSKNKTKTGTGSNFSVKFEEEGATNITCVVKDIKLEKTETREFIIDNVLPPIPVNFWVGLKNNMVGQNSKIKWMLYDGTGSGQLTWNGWTVKTPSKTLTSNLDEFTFPLSEYGLYTFTGTVTDNYNGYKKTATWTKNIKKTLAFTNGETIEPANPKSDPNIAKAIINVPEDVTVTFEVMVSRPVCSSNKQVVFYINGRSVTSVVAGVENEEGLYKTNITAKLIKGDNKFEIKHMVSPFHDKREASHIEIIDFPDTYELGNINYILELNTTGYDMGKTCNDRY